MKQENLESLALGIIEVIDYDIAKEVELAEDNDGNWREEGIIKQIVSILKKNFLEGE